VFEKFYRAKGSPAGGTGLGLAIARGFIQAQGGDITARNHPEGGAEFVIDVERTSEFVPPVASKTTNLEVRSTP
jgi:two-component system sensor histidine kinase KdpD